MNSLYAIIKSASRPLAVITAAGSGCYAMFLLNASNPINPEEDMNLCEDQALEKLMFSPKLPYPFWDYNWDGKMTETTSPQGHLDGRAAEVTGTVHHIFLVRHGQYEEDVPGVDGDKNDSRRKLTLLGRAQAEQTGQRLAQLRQTMEHNYNTNTITHTTTNPKQQQHQSEILPKAQPACEFRVIQSSDMTRAKETAQIIAKHLPGVPLAKPDRMLNECIPAAIIPTRDIYDPDVIADISDHRGRMERCFLKYLSRGNLGDETKHQVTILVCHGNVIRYLFCRCLQLPPEVWLRMSLFNCSITYLVVRPNGLVSARMLGDVGHLDYENCSFSMIPGFVW